MIERFRHWFEYEKDAHAKTLKAFQTVPDTQHSSREFQKAITLFAHILTARKLWLYRFGVSSEPIFDLFPQNIALENLGALAEDMHRIWDAYLGQLNDEELGRVFTYQSLDNKRFRNTIEEILTQLFGHSLYHRGQIAQLVKALGGEPAVTDFVYWSRESLPDQID
jgi:uncharacterized damage-inducible protein DinB